MRTLLSAVVLLLLLASFRCSKNETGTPGKIYTGVVLHNICCQGVVSVIGDTLGQAVWIDSNITPVTTVYNVFRVANPCQFSGPVEHDTIRFRLVTKPPQNCACCMLYIRTPDSSLAIQVVR